jgi:hypothetical protein
MERAIVQNAVAFVNSYYGLDMASNAAQVDAITTSGWLVTVWIGAYLKQRVLVQSDGTVRRHADADQSLALGQ